MKIRLITDNHDAAVGMRLAGIESVSAGTREELLKALASFTADSDTAVVLITNGLYESFAADVDEIKKTHMTPLITAIPESGEDFASDALTRYVRDAVGMS